MKHSKPIDITAYAAERSARSPEFKAAYEKANAEHARLQDKARAERILERLKQTGRIADVDWSFLSGDDRKEADRMFIAFLRGRKP